MIWSDRNGASVGCRTVREKKVHLGKKKGITIGNPLVHTHGPCGEWQSHHQLGRRTLPVKEADWTKRGIRDPISIKKTGMHAINYDGGHHQLLEVFSNLASIGKSELWGYPKLFNICLFFSTFVLNAGQLHHLPFVSCLWQRVCCVLYIWRVILELPQKSFSMFSSSLINCESYQITWGDRTSFYSFPIAVCTALTP